MLEICKYEQIIKKKKGSTSLILKHISYLLLFDTAKISIIFQITKLFPNYFKPKVSFSCLEGVKRVKLFFIYILLSNSC